MLWNFSLDHLLMSTDYFYIVELFHKWIKNLNIFLMYNNIQIIFKLGFQWYSSEKLYLLNSYVAIK